MSNIVDAFSISVLYNGSMKNCAESLMGAIPWGFFHAQTEVIVVGYRRVSYAEQIWYIIRYKLRQLFRKEDSSAK